MISLLSCSINGVDITIYPASGSRLAALHDNAATAVEHTTCNYGLEVSLQQIASSRGMTVAATDDLNEVRAIERRDHPFFIATLYQPQLISTAEQPHPIFTGLVAAASSPSC